MTAKKSPRPVGKARRTPETRAIDAAIQRAGRQWIRGKSHPPEVESLLSPIRQIVEEIEPKLAALSPANKLTNEDIRRVWDAIYACEPVHSLPSATFEQWPIDAANEFLELNRRISKAEDRIKGIIGKPAFAAADPRSHPYSEVMAKLDDLQKVVAGESGQQQAELASPPGETITETARTAKRRSTAATVEALKSSAEVRADTTPPDDSTGKTNEDNGGKYRLGPGRSVSCNGKTVELSRQEFRIFMAIKHRDSIPLGGLMCPAHDDAVWNERFDQNDKGKVQKIQKAISRLDGRLMTADVPISVRVSAPDLIVTYR